MIVSDAPSKIGKRSACPVPTINLLQLDQLNEILQSATILAGTYSSATITISGNPGDVTLIASAEPGFAEAPGSGDGSVKCYVRSYFTGFAQATTN